jgi:type VII secretion integral membrane protein EccD
MSDSLCRLTVVCGTDRAVDVALPRRLPIGRLLPSLLDIVRQDNDLPETPCGWRLAWLGGHCLDEEISLSDNGVRDGDMVVLTMHHTPAPQRFTLDPAHAVADLRRSSVPSALSALCGIYVAAVVAIGLATRVTLDRAAAAAVVCTAAAVGAVIARRRHADPSVCVPLSIAATAFAVTAGYLAIPAGQPAAHILSACTAGFCVATVLHHLLDCGTVCLTALSAVLLAVAIVAFVAVMWEVRPQAGGAVLATLGFAILAVAPRIAIAVSGIGPMIPAADAPSDEIPPDESPPVDTDAALRAHLVLSGLVIGSSAACALGVVTVGVWTILGGGSPQGPAALSAVTAAALALRARIHLSSDHRVALIAAGLVCGTMFFALGLSALPQQGAWLSVLAAAAGVAAVAPIELSPFVHRLVEAVDRVVVAAVVPVACWVGGVYGLVREISPL